MTQGRAMDWPQMGRWWHVRGLRAEQYKKSDTREVRGKREEGYFSSSWGKIGGRLLVLQVEAEARPQLLRP
jgi:hypothetical protein